MSPLIAFQGAHLSEIQVLHGQHVGHCQDCESFLHVLALALAALSELFPGVKQNKWLTLCNQSDASDVTLASRVSWSHASTCTSRHRAFLTYVRLTERSNACT